MRPGILLAVGALLIACFGVTLFSAPIRKKIGKASTPHLQAPKVVGAAGLIAVAQHQLDLGTLPAAAQYAGAASKKAPILDDYAEYIRAQGQYGLKKYPEGAKAATHVFDQVPVSPFVGAAAAIAVRAGLDGDNPKQALELVKKYHER